MADIYTAGMTGAEFLAALNRRNIFNVLDYGAVGDDSTDNTTALQAVIELAKVNGGIVFIPSGTYKTGKLTTYSNVKIIGDGGTSILKSIAAEPLLESLYTTWVGKPCGDNGASNIKLEGDNLGTIGLNTQIWNSFHLDGLYISNFTTCGINLHGTLIGSINDCFITNCVIGILSDSHLGIMSNLITIKNGQIMQNTKYGISWNIGYMLKLDNVDLEDNGVEGDATTGAVYYNCYGVNSGDQNLGLIMNGCWLESNFGEVVHINDVNLAQMVSIISDTMFINNICLHDIKLNGTTNYNKLFLRNCVLKDDNDLLVVGAYANVINIGSFLKFNITESNGGKYHNTIGYDGKLSPRQIVAALTDDTPSAAEINAATGLTPATAGAGWKCTIKDSNGSGLAYIIESNGTTWNYIKMAVAS